jgi:sugar transferase (PEP-CTERM/EpsH1 system associated)
MHILYVTPYVPSLIRTRPYNLIRALMQLGHRITLLSAAGSSAEEQAEAEELANLGVRTEVFPVARTRSLLNCLQAFPTAEPLQAAYSYHPKMERRLVQLLREEAFSVLHIEHLRASRLAREVVRTTENDGVPLVYDSVDSISLLFEQAARSGAQWRSRLMTTIDLDRTRQYEAWLLTQFNQVVVTSRRDKEALEGLGQRYLPPGTRLAPITVVTNGVDLDYFQPSKDTVQRDEKTVIFTGKMSYHANVTAVLYFARQVLPRIWAKDPNVQFQIVGKEPPEAVKRLAADDRIQVTGTVVDLRPYLSQATVAVCPATYAVGIQNKVLEAMAMGTPVVSTPEGSAALAAEDGLEILAVEGERKMADAVLQVLHSPGLAQSLSEAGKRYVQSHHSWKAAAQQLVALYECARMV